MYNIVWEIVKTCVVGSLGLVITLGFLYVAVMMILGIAKSIMNTFKK